MNLCIILKLFSINIKSNVKNNVVNACGVGLFGTFDPLSGILLCSSVCLQPSQANLPSVNLCKPCDPVC